MGSQHKPALANGWELTVSTAVVGHPGHAVTEFTKISLFNSFSYTFWKSIDTPEQRENQRVVLQKHYDELDMPIRF